MIAKDWILDAANDIAGAARIRSSGGIVFTAETVALLIERHAPFKRDVAYMPVPRCETCRHWESHDGVCNKMLTFDAKMWPSMYDAIHTEADFGCVQWEAK